MGKVFSTAPVATTKRRAIIFLLLPRGVGRVKCPAARMIFTFMLRDVLRVIWRYLRDHGGDMFAQAREIDWRLARAAPKSARRAPCGSSAYGKQGIARNSLR